jgi:hypothetical protein
VNGSEKGYVFSMESLSPIQQALDDDPQEVKPGLLSR